MRNYSGTSTSNHKLMDKLLNCIRDDKCKSISIPKLEEEQCRYLSEMENDDRYTSNKQFLYSIYPIREIKQKIPVLSLSQFHSMSEPDIFITTRYNDAWLKSMYVYEIELKTVNQSEIDGSSILKHTLIKQPRVYSSKNQLTMEYMDVIYKYVSGHKQKIPYETYKGLCNRYIRHPSGTNEPLFIGLSTNNPSITNRYKRGDSIKLFPTGQFRIATYDLHTAIYMAKQMRYGIVLQIKYDIESILIDTTLLHPETNKQLNLGFYPVLIKDSLMDAVVTRLYSQLPYPHKIISDDTSTFLSSVYKSLHPYMSLETTYIYSVIHNDAIADRIIDSDGFIIEPAVSPEFLSKYNHKYYYYGIGVPVSISDAYNHFIDVSLSTKHKYKLACGCLVDRKEFDKKLQPNIYIWNGFQNVWYQCSGCNVLFGNKIQSPLNQTPLEVHIHSSYTEYIFKKHGKKVKIYPSTFETRFENGYTLFYKLITTMVGRGMAEICYKHLKNYNESNQASLFSFMDICAAHGCSEYTCGTSHIHTYKNVTIYDYTTRSIPRVQSSRDLLQSILRVENDYMYIYRLLFSNIDALSKSGLSKPNDIAACMKQKKDSIQKKCERYNLRSCFGTKQKMCEKLEMYKSEDTPINKNIPLEYDKLMDIEKKNVIILVCMAIVYKKCTDMNISRDVYHDILESLAFEQYKSPELYTLGIVPPVENEEWTVMAFEKAILCAKKILGPTYKKQLDFILSYRF